MLQWSWNVNGLQVRNQLADGQAIVAPVAVGNGGCRFAEAGIAGLFSSEPPHSRDFGRVVAGAARSITRAPTRRRVAGEQEEGRARLLFGMFYAGADGGAG